MTRWTLDFGTSRGGTEYHCLITDEQGYAVDTFYGSDPQFMFEEVAALLESEATGTGWTISERSDKETA